MKRIVAFTLIELLVVIATVGVIVGIMMPSLASARREGIRVVCASDLHQLGLAANMYLDDHRDRYWPYYADVAGGRLWWSGFEEGGPNTGMVDRPLDQTRGVLAPYLSTLGDRFQCPAFPYHDAAFFSKFTDRRASFGFNLHLASSHRQKYAGRESRVLIFADGIHFDQPNKFNEGHYIKHNSNTAMMSGYAHFRHAGVAQMVMMDGHVEAQRLQGGLTKWSVAVRRAISSLRMAPMRSMGNRIEYRRPGCAI